MALKLAPGQISGRYTQSSSNSRWARMVEHAKPKLKLFRGTELVGTITNLDSDWPWIGGQIELTSAAEQYKHIWEFWTVEGNREKVPPFEVPEDIDENWFIEDEQGGRIQIEFPAIHADGAVWWREY